MSDDGFPMFGDNVSYRIPLGMSGCCVYPLFNNWVRVDAFV